MSEWYAKTWYAVRDGWKLHSINWDREGETVEEVWVKDDRTRNLEHELHEDRGQEPKGR